MLLVLLGGSMLPGPTGWGIGMSSAPRMMEANGTEASNTTGVGANVAHWISPIHLPHGTACFVIASCPFQCSARVLRVRRGCGGGTPARHFLPERYLIALEQIACYRQVSCTEAPWKIP